MILIPQRILSGVCEITTGAFSIMQRPPVYTGESAALNVQVAFKFQNVDYALPESVVAEMYLRYPNTELMTVAVEMTKSGNTASGVLNADQTAMAGYPLLVIQLTDTDTSSVIVACATALKISDVRGNLVIDSRAPSPSEIIYIGRSPYIDPTTGHWMQWDVSTSGYVDTGVEAAGKPATFTADATTLPAGQSATASIGGTALNPVLNLGIPKGDTGNAAGFDTPTASVDANVGTPSVTIFASGPNTAKQFDFQFHNLKGADGTIGYTPNIGIGTVQSVPEGSQAEVTRTGSDENPILNFKLPRSGDGIGFYSVDPVIAVSDWVLDSTSGKYKYEYSDTTISTRMHVVEWYLADWNTMLGSTDVIVGTSKITVWTDVIPTATWNLHVDFGVDGSEVLDEVGDIGEEVIQLSQQIDDLPPVIVTVTVDANGATMSASDQAKLTVDMVMCWFSGGQSYLNSDLRITPGNNTVSLVGTASISTTFLVGFIHTSSDIAKVSVIKANHIDISNEITSANSKITIRGITCMKCGAIIHLNASIVCASPINEWEKVLNIGQYAVKTESVCSLYSDGYLSMLTNNVLYIPAGTNQLINRSTLNSGTYAIDLLLAI